MAQAYETGMVGTSRQNMTGAFIDPCDAGILGEKHQIGLPISDKT
jgi:hypothetical protein